MNILFQFHIIFFEIDKVKCLQPHGRQKAIDIGGEGQSSAEGLGGLVRPLVGPGQDPGGGSRGETSEAPRILSF